jgi:hypothetical protein
MHTEQTRRMMSEVQDSSQTKREEIRQWHKILKLSAQKISNYFFAPLHVYNSTVIVFSLV